MGNSGISLTRVLPNETSGILLTLGRAQLDAFNAISRQHRGTRVLALLDARIATSPETASAAARRTAVEQAIEDGTPLGFASDEDTARLALLWLLPEALRRHPLAASVLIRVLNNDALTPAERLDFIDANVVRRRR